MCMRFEYLNVVELSFEKLRTDKWRVNLRARVQCDRANFNALTCSTVTGTRIPSFQSAVMPSLRAKTPVRRVEGVQAETAKASACVANDRLPLTVNDLNDLVSDCMICQRDSDSAVES